MLKGNRGSLLFALVSLNSHWEGCGVLSVGVKMAIWHGFVGFKWVKAEVAEALAGNGRRWQAWVEVAGCGESTRWSPKSLMAGNPAAVAMKGGVSGRGIGEE